MTATLTKGPDLPDDWKSWTPAAQEKLLDGLRRANIETWKPFYCRRSDCDGNHHITADSGPKCIDGFAHSWSSESGEWRCTTEERDEEGHLRAKCAARGTPDDEWLWRHGRVDQHPPPAYLDWLVWLLMAGRGAGKTRAGSEWVHRLAEKFPGCRIALISPTRQDIRDTQVEGESGILATARPGMVPEWEPSKMLLTWPNGSRAYGYSGEEPDRLRGKQHHFAWVDEPAHIPLIESVWYNLQFGLRLGEKPRICLTTSPLPTPWLRKIVADAATRISNASTYANIRNLAPRFAKIVLGNYEGTRLGRQEIHGQILEDVEGALWNGQMIEFGRILAEMEDRAANPVTVDHTAAIPDLDRILVGVDPAGTSTRKSDETGIIVGGSRDDEQYLWADYSGRYSPDGWARKVLWAHDTWDADAIVVETTYGKELVTANLKAYCDSVGRQMPRIIEVDSRRGKLIRAEPIVSFFERGQAHIVGILEKLEDQMTTWKPGDKSPDRLDAMVHLMTELCRGASVGSITTPYDLLRRGRDSVTRTIFGRTTA